MAKVIVVILRLRKGAAPNGVVSYHQSLDKTERVGTFRKLRCELQRGGPE